MRENKLLSDRVHDLEMELTRVNTSFTEVRTAHSHPYDVAGEINRLHIGEASLSKCLATNIFLLVPKELVSKDLVLFLSELSLGFNMQKRRSSKGKDMCGNFRYYNNTLKIKANGGRWVEGGKSLVETTGSLTQTGFRGREDGYFMCSCSSR